MQFLFYVMVVSLIIGLVAALVLPAVSLVEPSRYSLLTGSRSADGLNPRKEAHMQFLFYVMVVSFIIGLVAALVWVFAAISPTRPGGIVSDEELSSIVSDEELSSTEQELRRQLRAAGVDRSAIEIATMSDREFDQCWAYIRALGDSATTLPPIPRCLLRREGSVTT